MRFLEAAHLQRSEGLGASKRGGDHDYGVSQSPKHILQTCKIPAGEKTHSWSVCDEKVVEVRAVRARRPTAHVHFLVAAVTCFVLAASQ